MGEAQFEPQLPVSWQHALANELAVPYLHQLSAQLQARAAAGEIIFPPRDQIFYAFATTPITAVKVVILGQDPYHNPGEAMGLSFSVPRGKRVPPSLRNVYQELARDVGVAMPTHGDLTTWATQGVFLLNSMLTVAAGAPQSHQALGWQPFTDAVIQAISQQREHVVFMLWGGYARKKRALIDSQKHLVLEAAHPSPLAGKAFVGCQHFSQANAYLIAHGVTPIDWSLPL